VNVPFCRWEQKTIEYRNCVGRTVSDVIAWPVECGHFHRALDFAETLERNWPQLHFGFDRRKERHVIFRWTPQITPVGSGITEFSDLLVVENFLDIVIDMKFQIEVITKEKGRRMIFPPRNYGAWALEEIAKYDPRRLTPDSSWVSEMLDARADAAEAAAQKELRRKSEDMVNDMMSFADRGNPWFHRKQFRQRKVRPNHPKQELAVA